MATKNSASEHRVFNARLAERLNTDSRTAAELLSHMVDIITAESAALNTVAIAGFGSFVTTQTDEYTVQNPDGSQTLMPPAITTVFNPGTKLRKIALSAPKNNLP